jgi:hypothetical protein
MAIVSTKTHHFDISVSRTSLSHISFGNRNIGSSISLFLDPPFVSSDIFNCDRSEGELSEHLVQYISYTLLPDCYRPNHDEDSSGVPMSLIGSVAVS